MTEDEEHDPRGCEACRNAVARTYRELRRKDVGDVPAFFAAVRVLALRHPEFDAAERLTLAAEWLAAPLD